MAAAKKTKAAPRKRAAAKPKRAKAKRKYVTPVGVTGGAVGTVGSALLTPKTGKQGSTASALYWLTGEPKLPWNDRLKRAADVIGQNARDLNTYVPLGAGIAASAAPRIPIVKHLARPLNDAIRAFTRGKWRL